MDSEQDAKICVVCSKASLSSIGGNSFGGDGALSNQEQFSIFCGELELSCKHLEGDKSVQKFEAVKFLDALESQDDKLCVCEKCLGLVGEAMGRKKSLDEVECQVLKLQLELLVKMKELEQCTELYYKEMEGIFERVRSSEVDYDLLMISSRNIGRWRKCDVLQFREKIFDVVTYLGMFREDVNDKLVRDSEWRKGINTPSKFPPNNVKSTTPPLDNFATSPTSAPSPPPLSPMEGFQDDPSDLEEEESSLPLNEAHPQAPALVKSEPVTTKRMITRRSQRNRTRTRAPETDSEEEDKQSSEEEDKDDEYVAQEPDSDKDEEFEPTKKKAKYPSQRRRGRGTVPGGSSSISKEKRVYAVGLALSEVDVSNMSRPRRVLVQSILRRNALNAIDKEGSGQEPEEDKDSLHWTSKWTYDKQTDKIMLADFEVILVEPETFKDNPVSLALQCGPCGYQESFKFEDPDNIDATTLRTSIYRLQENMFEHVMGPEHLNLKKKKKIWRERPGSSTDKPKEKLSKANAEKIKKALSKLDLSAMIPAKRQLIQAIIRKNVLLPTDKIPDNPTTSSGEALPNLDNLPILHRWAYDPSSDQISLSGFEVKLLQDDSSISLQCSDCGHQDTRRVDNPSKIKIHLDRLQLRLFNHVLGDKHLNLFQCPLCAYQSPALQPAKYHQEIHTNGTEGLCSICGQKFNCSDSLNRHKAYHDQKIRHAKFSKYECRICGRPMASGSTLRAHMDSHKSAEERAQTVCPFCGKTLFKSAFKDHKRRCAVMLKDKPRILCTVCGSSFRYPGGLRQHMASIHGELEEDAPGHLRRRKEIRDKGRERCGICGKMVKYVREHQKNVHGGGGGGGVSLRKAYFCRKGCGRRYWQTASLGRHEGKCTGLVETPWPEGPSGGSWVSSSGT